VERELSHFERDTRQQLVRYGIVGLASNAVLYVAYLLLSAAGVGHTAAMTSVYCAGVLGTFLFNRRWTFGHTGAIPGAMLRYVATYAVGYLFNVVSLVVMVDHAGLPHQWVMLVLVFACAGIIFLLQRYWCFPLRRP
jgi:putative flippase GtrA